MLELERFRKLEVAIDTATTEGTATIDTLTLLLANVPVYADEAAAESGGAIEGSIYRITTTGALHIKQANS